MNKKEQIYKSVWDIYVGGTDLGSLRMGEIAEASGIPKGTIYEYFRTREQLVSEAIVWALEQAAEALCKEMEKADDFGRRWDAVLEWVRSPAGRTVFAMEFLNWEGFPGLLREKLRQDKDSCRHMARLVMDKLIEASGDPPKGNVMARNTALLSALAPVILYDREPEQFPGVTWEEAKSYSKKLLKAAFMA